MLNQCLPKTFLHSVDNVMIITRWTKRQRHCTNMAIMNKLLLLVCAVLVFLAGSSYAFDDPDPTSFESNRVGSLEKCRNFASSFKSVGWTDDISNFQDSFGPPQNVNEPVDQEEQILDFNFDSYTVITLDCLNDSCSARCWSKF